MDRMAVFNTYIQNIHDAYTTCADKFHETYAREFDSWICTYNFGSNSEALKYKHDVFNKFVDLAISYRLGYSDQPPLVSNVIDDLSMTVNSDVYVVPLSKVLDELVRGAVPEKLIYDLYNKLNNYKLPGNIVEHVVNKLHTQS